MKTKGSTTRDFATAIAIFGATLGFVLITLPWTHANELTAQCGDPPCPKKRTPTPASTPHVKRVKRPPKDKTTGSGGGAPRTTNPNSNANGNANNGSSADPKPSVSADRNANKSNNANVAGAGTATTPILPDPPKGSKTDLLGIGELPNLGNRLEPKPNPDWGLLIPVSETLESRSRQVVYTKGEFSELSGKRRVIVNAENAAMADKVTARLREYSGLEIVKTAGEAEFAININTYSHSGDVFMGITKTFTGGSMIVTIRDTSLPIPRIIWSHTEGGADGAFDKLAKRFIRDLKKLRGEK